MPQSLVEHIRYPEDLFKIQSRTLLTYHMTNPSVYYKQRRLLGAPEGDLRDPGVSCPPYYAVMEIPGGDRHEYVLLTPFTQEESPT